MTAASAVREIAVDAGFAVVAGGVSVAKKTFTGFRVAGAFD